MRKRSFVVDHCILPLMTSLKRFVADDLFSFNTVNLDKLTETYGPPFYFEYLAHWPEYFTIARSPAGYAMGYIMGKVEGPGEDWHGHVTAVSTGAEFRRLGLGNKFMNTLEEVCVCVRDTPPRPPTRTLPRVKAAAGD